MFFGKLKPVLYLLVMFIVLAGFGSQHPCLAGQDDDKLINGGPIYHGDAGIKSMALTVNVFWGEEYLPQMLDIMARHKVKATFFIGGVWAEKFPDLVKSIEAAGHEIGSHGYSHPHPDRIGKHGNLEDINKAGKIIYQITGHIPQLYAPPYGERGPAVLEAAREAGCTTILWSIDTVDWQRPGADVIAHRVLDRAENGAIVLMHPTAPTVEALPQIITGLQEKGLSLVTVSELLAQSKE